MTLLQRSSDEWLQTDQWSRGRGGVIAAFAHMSSRIVGRSGESCPVQLSNPNTALHVAVIFVRGRKDDHWSAVVLCDTHEERSAQWDSVINAADCQKHDSCTGNGKNAAELPFLTFVVEWGACLNVRCRVRCAIGHYDGQHGVVFGRFRSSYFSFLLPLQAQ